MKWLTCLLSLFTSLAMAGVTRHATPEDYRKILGGLAPGDTLILQAGVYSRGLPLSNCNGTADAWITIQGPDKGVAEIRQTQSANCVEIVHSSYVALKRLSILGEGPRGIPGLFGISAKGGLKNSVHHILIEDCVIRDWNTSQQAVGISTKTPVWDWVIRRNIIRNCGTGLYLGNSDGTSPFVRGIIENNLVHDPIGYCMEIKYQKTYPTLEGLPTSPSSTLIRHNVFMKNDAPSPDGDRPNVLVGGFPDSGPGSENLYEIYGNLFWYNPRESLLRASGRVTIHDNVFGNCPSLQHEAITLRSHDLPLKLAHVYHNTIHATARGIRIGSQALEKQAVQGNVIFATEALLDRAAANASGNVIGLPEEASKHLIHPSSALGSLDLRPRPGQCEGTLLDLSLFQNEADFDKDFEGRPKARHRGAYAGDAKAAGWPLQKALKRL